MLGLGLTVIGLSAIHTSGEHIAFSRQVFFMGVSLAVMAAVACIHYKQIAESSYPLILAALLMLVVVLLPFMPQAIVPVRNGARRWFDLGGFSFQPSELAKVAYVLAMAKYLRYRENYRTLRGLLIPLGMTFIPMGLVLVEPDLGTSLVFLPIYFAMLLAAGARIKHLLLLILIGLCLLPAMYPLLQPHQKDRIDDIVARLRGDTRHEQTISFQGKTAARLIGAGGLLGYDTQRANQLVRYNRLPEAQNDMVYTVVCTRWGLLGGLLLILIYFCMLALLLMLAAFNRDPFGRLVVVGFAALLFTQMFINIGMNIGLLPITGITLPFVSAGGSSLLVSFGMLGLILNVTHHRPLLSRPSFEFGARPALRT